MSIQWDTEDSGSKNPEFFFPKIHYGFENFGVKRISVGKTTTPIILTTKTFFSAKTEVKEVMLP